ncbi:MAG: hypothetical protein ACK5B9_07655 [Flavobacteriia bacterium]|jgi:hypothetical protein
MHLKSQLTLSLIEDQGSENRKRWVNYLIENQIDLRDFVDLVLSDRKLALRFIWLVGDLCEQNAAYVSPAVPAFYALKDQVKFPNYDRSLAKMFLWCGIPENREGEIIDVLFSWIMDSKVSVATKTNAMLALQKELNKYPELKQELKLVIQDQLDKNSVSFRNCAKKILQDL